MSSILKLKIKHNDWLLADTCPQAANHCAVFPRFSEMIDNGPVGNVTSPSPAVQVFSPSGVIHARSRSEPLVNTISSCGSMLHKPTMSPFRERICSDSTVELSPRRAFQEM